MGILNSESQSGSGSTAEGAVRARVSVRVGIGVIVKFVKGIWRRKAQQLLKRRQDGDDSHFFLTEISRV